MSGQLIVIEGLIGAGKSTLANSLAEKLGYKLFLEPLVENPYLEKFYADPKRYGLEMQYWLMSKRFSQHQEAIDHLWRTGQGVIMDRSIYGDAVFAKKNYLDGNIDPLGLQNYMHMRDVMFRLLMIPHICLYLRASPERCQERIALRGRDCERSIPLAYLRGLEDLYLELLVEFEDRGTKVLNLDWEEFRSGESVLSELKAQDLVPEPFANYPVLPRFRPQYHETAS